MVSSKKIISPIEFSTKAKTLLDLREVISCANIAPIAFFSVKEWGAGKEQCLKSVLSTIGNGPYIVRSSSHNEDSLQQSNAGAFTSVLNVTKHNLEPLLRKLFPLMKSQTTRMKCLFNPCLRMLIFLASHSVTIQTPARHIV